jgi:hypothetical protein
LQSFDIRGEHEVKTGTSIASSTEAVETFEEVYRMKNVRNIALSIISSALLAGAAWALPASPAGHQSGTQSQNAAQLQSASGKITAVSSSSFTLKTVPTNPPSRSEASMQSQDPNQSKDQGKEMTFTIDQNTTVDGKLAVGANADVSYRTDANGNNVAVTVHVTPQP